MKLEFAFVYEPDLVAGVEDARRVLLDFYLSADLGHAIQTVKPGLESHHVSFEIVPPTGTAIGQPFIDPDSGLTIRAFTASTKRQRRGLHGRRRLHVCAEHSAAQQP